MRKKKTTYRPRNWGQYNAALRQRGSLTLWLSEEAIAHWLNQDRSGERGTPATYSDLAIEAMAALQALFRLPGRQTQGLLQSLFALLKIDLPVPEHSTLARRRAQLAPHLPLHSLRAARHLVIDSTGLKVYGEGEWKVRQHGWARRRTWRKLHLAVDAETSEVVSAIASTNNVSDDAMLPELLAGVPGPVEQVSADGAYDKRGCYEAIAAHRARAAIPPRQGARIWRHGNRGGERHARDENVRRIRQVGRREWKRESGYHRRSLAETAIFRFKRIFGERLATRRFENQMVEVFTKCMMLNRMTHLGMPDSYAVDG